MSMDPATGIGDRPPLPLGQDSAAPGTPPPAPAAPPPGYGPTAAAPTRLNVVYHLVIGIAIGITSLFTALAWPFAILTGMVIGKAESDRRLGRTERTSMVSILAVTGGVLAMLFAGVIVGGLIAFIVVALAAFSERVAENASDIDRTMARIIITLVAVVVWFTALYVLDLKVNLSFG